MEHNTKMRTCTNYRKDFTPEERIKYNEYVKQRMRIYHASDKAKANRQAYYQLKKKINQEQQSDVCVK